MNNKDYAHAEQPVPENVLHKMADYIDKLTNEQIAEMTFDESMFFMLQFDKENINLDRRLKKSHKDSVDYHFDDYTLEDPQKLMGLRDRYRSLSTRMANARANTKRLKKNSNVINFESKMSPCFDKSAISELRKMFEKKRLRVATERER